MHTQDIRNIRKLVLKRYPDSAERLAIMPDKQVMKVYGHIEKEQKTTPGYRQMTLFDNEFVNKIWG